MSRLLPAAFIAATAATTNLLPTTAPAAAPDDAKVVAQATQGRLKKLKGRYYDKDCARQIEYQADVVDLNGDGRPEVFTRHFDGLCYGMAGVQLELYVQDGSGRWQPQFGFPGEYTILKTRHLGYPDIKIGGPGMCFPVWRWNGTSYALFKKCAR